MAMQMQLKKRSTKNTAAVMLEPIQGEGGVIIPPEDYLKAGIRNLSKRIMSFLSLMKFKLVWAEPVNYLPVIMKEFDRMS